MPFFIHDVGHGIKTPIDLHKIGDRLAPPEPLTKSAKASSALAQEQDPLSQRDLLRHHANQQPFSPLKRPKPFYQYDQSEQVALDIMSAPVLFSRISDTPVQMKTLMNEHEIHHLVIVDRENVVIGILHAWQLEESNFALLPQDQKSTIPLAWLSPFLSTTTNTPLGHIAQAMLQSNQDVVLVSENHEIVGLITTKNFLRLFAQKASKSLEA